jgi:hypothetical protein
MLKGALVPQVLLATPCDESGAPSGVVRHAGPLPEWLVPLARLSQDLAVKGGGGPDAELGPKLKRAITTEPDLAAQFPPHERA